MSSWNVTSSPRMILRLRESGQKSGSLRRYLDLKRDINDTCLVAPRDGQLIYLSALQRGFSREGEVIARVLAMDEFEIEAEIPVALWALSAKRTLSDPMILKDK